MTAWRSLEAYFSQGDACGFSLDVDEIPTGRREETKAAVRESLDAGDDGRWHCPHPAEDGHDQCLFHLSSDVRPAGVSVTDRLLDVLSTPSQDESRRERRRRKQFIGAELPDLRLADEVVSGDDNFPVDLRCVSFDEVRLDNARLGDPLDVRGATGSSFSATNASFTRLYAQGSSLGTAAFDHSSIGRGYFDDATADVLRFYFADIEYANFHRMEATHTSFMYATLGEVGFFDADLGVATFYGASFDGGYFNGAGFDYLNFKSTSGGSCHFDGASAIAATFATSDFGSVNLSDAQFDRTLANRADWDDGSLDGASLGVATFDDGRFGSLSLADVTIHRSVSFDDSLVEDHLTFTPEAVEGDGVAYVSWRRADLPAGTLHNPENTPMVHDFADAKLGDLRVEADVDQPLDRFRFLRTEFTGFDFSKQSALDLDATNHVIHDLEADPVELATLRAVQKTVTDFHPAVDSNVIGAASRGNETDFDAVDPDAAPTDTGARAYELAAESVAEGELSWPDEPAIDDLETTYLMAKTGASAVGDSTASGHFFVKERTYRRYGHWAAASDTGLSWESRLERASAWLRNWLFAMTAGYGERPVRTILASAGTIVLFSFPYLYLQPVVEGIENPTYADYLVFSFQSFITFIVGTTFDNPPLSVRVASSVEGFIGAFFVALFVFALTRQVHR